MNIYKVVYANNEVISCKALNEEVTVDGMYQYIHKKGKLIYALIKAKAEDEARGVAQSIIREVSETIFGNDFIY